MKKIFLLILLIIFPITLTGCSLGITTSSRTTGGIFKSYDFGESFEDSNKAIINNKLSNIGGVNVSVIRMDPQDNKKIYVGTNGNGIYYSENGGLEWRNIFSKGKVYDLVLDAKNSGVVYVSFGSQIYKTLDLGEKWDLIYSEERTMAKINTLAIDFVDNLTLYFGTSEGEVYKTQDGGESWKIVLEADDDIEKILVNPKNVRKIYVATRREGLYKSLDKGLSWAKLAYYNEDDRESRRNFRGVEDFFDMAFDSTKNDALIVASDFGLLKTTDGGNFWYEVPILTPPSSKNVYIRSLAINSNDGDQIYYATDQTFYRTFDGGKTWLAEKLPSTRSGNSILVDFKNGNVVYLGMASVDN